MNTKNRRLARRIITITSTATGLIITYNPRHSKYGLKRKIKAGQHYTIPENSQYVLRYSD